MEKTEVTPLEHHWGLVLRTNCKVGRLEREGGSWRDVKARSEAKMGHLNGKGQKGKHPQSLWLG